MTDQTTPIGEPSVILLAEDNPSHAELVKRSLEDHQISNRIQHVLDGEQVLDYLYQRGRFSDQDAAPRPQLILLDLRLPRMDGLEVLEKIKDDEDLRLIPVIILTTSEAERDVARAYQLHANSYVAKPIDFDKFSSLMEEIGIYWLGWNHSA